LELVEDSSLVESFVVKIRLKASCKIINIFKNIDLLEGLWVLYFRHHTSKTTS